VGAAIRTGIEYAITHEYDIIVIMAGNDKDNPDEIPQLLELSSKTILILCKARAI